MAETLSFQSVLDHLLDSKKDIPQSHLQLYSDLDPKSLRLFMDIWSSVKPERKLLLLSELLKNLDTDNIVNYEDIGKALLKDADANVRAAAIGLLAESNDPKLASTLIDIFLTDTELAPRMEAATLLGEFVLLGELEELDADLKTRIEDALISVIRSEQNSALRKRALESLGYSARDEMTNIIETAFNREEAGWVASALRAMGRSHDNQWNDDVVSKLLDEDPRIRFAAAEAAGELNIEAAAPIMLQMLEDEEEDDDVISATIWSLSQIGGEDARIYIVNLIENTEDEDLVAFLEDALENLDFNEEMDKFDLLTLDEDDLEDLDELDELEDDEEDK
jgi:HEAT repeat protein